FPQGTPVTTAGEMMRDFHVTFPPGTDPSTVVSVYPTQLFEVVLGFIMFSILWRIRDHKHAEGWLFGVWCVLAGIERFIIEFFRAKDDRFGLPFGLSTAQVIALAIAAIGVAIVAWRRDTGLDRSGIHGGSVPA